MKIRIYEVDNDVRLVECTAEGANFRISVGEVAKPFICIEPNVGCREIHGKVYITWDELVEIANETFGGYRPSIEAGVWY